VSDFYTSAYLRDEITRLIYPTIHWRRVALDDNYPLNAEYHSPPTSNEVDDFIFNCLSRERKIDLGGLHWRELEELVAELSSGDKKSK